MFKQEYCLQGFNHVSIARKEGNIWELSLILLFKSFKRDWWLRFRASVKVFSSDLGRIYYPNSLWMNWSPDWLHAQHLLNISTWMLYPLLNMNICKNKHLSSANMVSLNPFFQVLMWLERFHEMASLCAAVRMVPGTTVTLTITELGLTLINQLSSHTIRNPVASSTTSFTCFPSFNQSHVLPIL